MDDDFNFFIIAFFFRLNLHIKMECRNVNYCYVTEYNFSEKLLQFN